MAKLDQWWHGGGRIEFSTRARQISSVGPERGRRAPPKPSTEARIGHCPACRADCSEEDGVRALGRDPAQRAGAGKDPADQPLNERELSLLRMFAAGRSNREIADELYLSVNTVNSCSYRSAPGRLQSWRGRFTKVGK